MVRDRPKSKYESK